MKIYKKIGSLLLLSLGMVSCRKYVEVPVQGQRVLEYTSDYRLLMNNFSGMEIACGLAPELSCDNVDLVATELQNSINGDATYRAIYTWNKPFYVDQTADFDWNNMYSGIYIFNTVLTGVMDSKGGTTELKNTLMGEALVHRAFNYFMLANTYGKQYDAATANADPAVPILLQPKLFVDLTRASVAQVYNQVLADIRQAIPLLPVKAETNYRPGKVAAYALLTKVYLNMRNFTKAAEFADSTLAISSELYDYNTSVATSTYTFPTQTNDKQVILRKVPRIAYGALQLSQPLLNLLGTKDLRYVLFAKAGNNFYPAFTGLGYWPRERYSGGNDKPASGLTVNETWLIRAECFARADKKEDAVKILNDLRKFRFAPADYTLLSASSADEALQMVVDERRREFFGTGIRWFDQKRLNKDPLFAKKMTRVLNNVTYTLDPNSNGYVFPLANMLIAQNPELVQNPK